MSDEFLNRLTGETVDPRRKLAYDEPASETPDILSGFPKRVISKPASERSMNNYPTPEEVYLEIHRS